MILWRNDKKMESKNTLNGKIKMEKNYIECISNEPFDCATENFPNHFQAKEFGVFLHKQTQAFGTGRIHYMHIYIHYTATLNWKLCEFRPTLSFGFEKNSCIAMNPTQAHSRCLVICSTKKIYFITFACHSKFVMLEMAILSTRPLTLQYLWHFAME